MNRTRAWLIVAVTYVVARLAVQLLVTEAVVWDPERVAQLLVVPVAQVAALELMRRIRRTRSW